MITLNIHHVVSMVRTQIQLTIEQHERLRALATREGVSLAELVRRGVNAVLSESERHERWAHLLGAAGSLHDPSATDVAREHDRYVEEAWKRP
ncbi:MAG: CopG family transcriptional regulator [Gemmatimonadota bacterium]